MPAEPTRLRELDAEADRRVVLGIDELKRSLPSSEELASVERALLGNLDADAEDSGIRRRLVPTRRVRPVASFVAAALLAAAAAVALGSRGVMKPASPGAAWTAGSARAAVLAPPQGRIAPRAQPDAAAVERRAPAPPWTDDLRIARRARVRAPRAATRFPSGQPFALAIERDPAADPIDRDAEIEAEEGRVNINSIPYTRVVLDGRPLGATPRVGVTVPAGEHTVLFVHPKRGRRSLRVNVDPGGTVLAAIRF